MTVDVAGMFAAVVRGGHLARFGRDPYGVAAVAVEMAGGDPTDCVLVFADGEVYLDATWDGKADDRLRATLDALAIVRRFLFPDAT